MIGRIMTQQVLNPFEEQKHVVGQSFYSIAPWCPLFEIQTSGRIPVHHHYSLAHVWKAIKLNVYLGKHARCHAKHLVPISYDNYIHFELFIYLVAGILLR